MQSWTYAFPAILALLAKVGIFFYARYSNVHNLQTRIYLLFLFALSIQNLSEIAVLVSHAERWPEPSGGRLYFSASIVAIAFFLHLALVMGRNSSRPEDNISTRGILFLYAPCFVLETLLWLTSLLISGFERVAYTYTKVPGPLYFLFELYAVGYLGAAAVLFLYGARTHVATFRRLQNRFLLIGLLPFVALVVAVIVLQHFGVRISATTTLPVAMTFFLGVTAYATHQHRLFDIEFFVPWSKLRKRKTAFYKKIQSLVAEIAEMNSVQRIVQSLSDALRCPVALIGGPQPVVAVAGEALGVARFPIRELRKVDHILVANEIAEVIPDIHKLMRQHKVAAIVPFHPHSQTASSWMLLGDAFSDQVYSPLDFKVVEGLFARLADHFLDNQLLLRAQLAEANHEMGALRRRLANAWEQLEAVRIKLASTEQENQSLRTRNATLLRDEISGIEADVLSQARTLDEHVTEFEARLIGHALERCNDDPERAAEMLGVPLLTLYYKIRQYHLQSWNKKR